MLYFFTKKYSPARLELFLLLPDKRCVIANSEKASARSSFAKRSWPADLVCIFLLISVCLAIGLPRYRGGIDWADEGFLAYGAVRVMEGQVPNRDFVSLQPPLSFYTVAAAFKLFGTSLASLRLLGLSIYVLIPLLIYAIARNFMNAAFSAVAALPATIFGIPYFGFVPFAVWQGIVVTLAAVTLYIQALATKRYWLAFSAGVLTTFSVFLRHDQAAYAVVSILILLIGLCCAKDAPTSTAELKRVFALWLISGATVAFGFAVFWWREGALPEMFKQLIILPLTVYGKTSSLPFPRFNSQSPLSQNAVTLLYYAPPIVEILAVIWIVRQIARRRFYRREAFLTFLTAWSALFFCQVLTRSDFGHLLLTLPPFFILTAYGISILLAQFRRVIAKISISILTAAAAICFLCLTSAVALPDLRKFNEVLELDRGGVRIDNGRFVSDFVRRVQQYVPPDRSILCLPYLPMFYFLCERRNPTRWNYLWPGDQTLQDHQNLVDQAKNDPPAVIFITAGDKMVSIPPAILAYVHREYRHAGDMGYVAVYLPRSATP